jgi:hypothetical protein
MTDEEPKRKAPAKPRVRRLAAAAAAEAEAEAGSASQAWFEPLTEKWFDEVPPPWLAAWSQDDTPIGCELAREKARAVAAAIPKQETPKDA